MPLIVGAILEKGPYQFPEFPDIPASEYGMSISIPMSDLRMGSMLERAQDRLVKQMRDAADQELLNILSDGVRRGPWVTWG